MLFHHINTPILVFIVSIFVSWHSHAHAEALETAEYNVGDIVFACNTASNFTNLRSWASAQNSYIIGQIPNGVRANIHRVYTNSAGYPYYEINILNDDHVIGGPGDFYTNSEGNFLRKDDGTLMFQREDSVYERYQGTRFRSGYVYHKALRASCDLTAEVPEDILILAQELADANPPLRPFQVWSFNANFDGTALYLPDLNRLYNLSALSELASLRHIDFSGSEVHELTPLAQLQALETISLYETNVRSIVPLTELPRLRVLNLFGTEVHEIDTLSEMQSLRELYLSSSKVSDISALDGLSSLQVLSLQNTEVSDFSPISTLRNLWYLDVARTSFDDPSIVSDLSLLKVARGVPALGPQISDGVEVYPYSGLPRSAGDFACPHQERRPINFSSSEIEDTLRIQIIGGNCDTARIDLSITTASGDVVHQSTALALSYTYEFQGGDGVRAMLLNFVDDSGADHTNLPTYEEMIASGAYDDIDRQLLERVRSENLPLFCHQVGKSYSQCFAYYQGSSALVFSSGS